MKNATITLKGKSPLIMNNPAQMTREKKTRKITEQKSAEAEAEATLYKNAKGKIYVPARCIYSMFLHASTGLKTGKSTLRTVLAGAIEIQPDEIILDNQKWEPFVCRCVIQRQGIMKSRAMFKEWSLTFTVVYDESWIQLKNLVDVLEIAGTKTGLLDYRPERSGPYGRFTVEKVVEK